MDISRQTRVSSTHRLSHNPVRVLTDWYDENERMVHDFLDDVSLNAAEMKLFVAMPDLSIADVRKLIADVNNLRAARQIAGFSRR